MIHVISVLVPGAVCHWTNKGICWSMISILSYFCDIMGYEKKIVKSLKLLHWTFEIARLMSSTVRDVEQSCDMSCVYAHPIDSYSKDFIFLMNQRKTKACTKKVTSLFCEV